MSAELPVAGMGVLAPPATSVHEAIASYRGKPLRIFLMCLGIWSLSNMDQSLFGFAVPGILTDLNIGIDKIGLILSAGFAFTAVAVVAIGIITDRVGRRIALAACLGLSGLFVGLQGLAATALGLAVVRAVAFASSGGLSPITNAYVAESAPPRLRGVMIGLLQCGYPIGWFVASLLVVPLMTQYGWRSIFLVGFAVVPLSFLVWWLTPESPRFERMLAYDANRETGLQRVRDVFSGLLRRRTILSAAAWFAMGAAYAGSAFFVPTFLHLVRGYTDAQAARIVGLSYGIGVIGYIGASLVGEFLLTRRKTIILWSWLGACAFLGFVWLPASEGQDIAWCGLMSVFFYGTTAILGTYLVELYPTRLRATGSAFGSASLSLGFALAPMAVAALIGAFGWQVAFSIFVAPCLVLVGVAVFGLDDLASGQAIEDY